MTRIGLVGGVTFGHTRSFLGLYNPRTPAGEDQMAYPHQPEIGARVVALADPALEQARQYASWVEGVELVTDDPGELVGQVEGVMICGDPSPERLERARLFLQAGTPTFVDKPLAQSVAEAEELVALAQATGTPLMSASGLRFSTELAGRDREALGELHGVLGVGPENLFLYGVHVVEFISAALGPGVRQVRSLGTPEKYHVYLEWGDGRSAVMVVGPAVQPGFRMILLGTKGNLPVTVADSPGFFGGMLRAFVGMVETRRPPLDYAVTLEVIRVLEAARLSLESGETLTLSSG